MDKKDRVRNRGLQYLHKEDTFFFSDFNTNRILNIVECNSY